MTTTTPPAVTLVQAATMLAAHVADHALPDPASLTVATSYGHSMVTAQLFCTTLPGIAADLLAWADTLSAVTVEAWRPPERDQVHLSLLSTLTGPMGAVELKVFGGVKYDPLRFADLQPDKYQGLPLSLGQLRTWAVNSPPTTDTPALEVPRGAR